MEDDNKAPKPGKGRGVLIQKFMKMKEEQQNAAVRQSQSQESSIEASGSVSQRLGYGPAAPQSTPTVAGAAPVPLGHGRASLLKFVQAKKSSIVQTPQPLVLASNPGRGASILSMLKNVCPVPRPAEQPIASPAIQAQQRGPAGQLPNKILSFQPQPTSTALRASQASSVVPVTQASSVVPVTQASSVVPVTQASTLTPDDDATGALGTFSELSITESRTSQTLYKLPQVAPKGTIGKKVDLSTNYINVVMEEGKGLFNYEVKYNPDIDSRPLRIKLLNEHLDSIGQVKVFDGVSLYLPQRLKNDRTQFQSTHPMDGKIIVLTIIYKKTQSMTDNISFFNVLLGRVMRSLSLIRIGQHNFNPDAVHPIPQHKLEVWPGYVTAIDEFEGGLKLCIDSKHRVMRTETVRDMMSHLSQRSNSKDVIIKELLGLSVFTRYNNKSYRVDDIAFDKNPRYEFEKGDSKITLLEYYKTHWNLEIRDKNQPLLVNISKTKLAQGGVQEKMILLVPELCFIASLTDSIRSDFRVMKDIDEITKQSPNDRRDVLKSFVRQVQTNEIPRKILSQWGLSLENELTNFTGRVLDTEKIYFGGNKTFKPAPGRPIDWSSAACQNPLLRVPQLNSWTIIYTQKDTNNTNNFVKEFMNIAKIMGMRPSDPRMISLKDDRIENYIREIRNNLHPDVNLMVFIFPTNRVDRYVAVKKLCCVETAVASQVIMSRTIGRPDKLRSITQKIALQINCKLGGALWSLEIPMKNCMICGIDVYHGGIGQSTKGSCAGFVASLDKMLSKWHSKVSMQGRGQELFDMLQICLRSAIKAYYKYNNEYPNRIIIYRDGVGNGQLETVSKYEVKQMRETFKHIDERYCPSLSVIVVQKRINTRLFAKLNSGLQNPEPGTVVDTCITRRELYDFFLVSQNIRQGSVSPSHYIIVHDTSQLTPNHFQHLTYKLCHLYYNWCGTIKVPAPCQYAHKLVSLVGQNLQQAPHMSLTDTLYYL